MSKVVWLSASLFLAGITSVAAGTIPAGGITSELVWMMMALSGVVTVAGLETPE